MSNEKDNNSNKSNQNDKDDNLSTNHEEEKANLKDENIKHVSESLDGNLSNETEEETIEKIKSDLEEAVDQKMRALADAENTRRRNSKELEQTRKYASLSLARDLISVFDSLEKAVETISEKKNDLTEEMKNILIGVEMTLDQLKQAFNNNNINQINPVGEKFDYNLHQAMFEKENNELEPGTIVEIMQPGWTLHDRLIRPAMVGVSKRAKKEE
tara:strand:+ start:314 stop:955 length:642 start_codon:yes stop_codon:yes gene_type:complete